MKKFFGFLRKQIYLNEKKVCFSAQGVWWFFALFSILLTGLVFAITTEHYVLVGARLVLHPTVLLWNILPVFLILVLLYGIFANALGAVSIASLFFLVIAIADAIKVSMRQSPLLPTDLLLVKEAFSIVGSFPTRDKLLIALFFIIMALLIFLAFYFGKRSILPIGKRCVMIFLPIVLFVLLNSAVYQDKERYDNYSTLGNIYFQVNQYNSKGLIYSFLYQCNSMRMEKPENYDAEACAQLEALPAEDLTEKELPNIIMIMGEAYSDLSENPHLDYTGYTDPMANFKALAEDSNSISGKLVVPHFGGGTSDTEYDVLTGLSTRLLNHSLASYNFIHQDVDALPSHFASIGYDTVSIHPGYAWFYDRLNVYPHLGFSQCYFLEDSFDAATQNKGGYINEEATFDKILSVMEEHEASDNPLFSFTVTIQNHGPYNGKYLEREQTFSCDIPLSEDENASLTEYFMGICDADEQIGRIWEYMENSEEPYVLVYFGDHLPALDLSLLQKLEYPINPNGTAQEEMAVYETPYLIWQNDAAKELCDFSQTAQTAQLPDHMRISSNYLGALLCELLELDGLSPLFDFINDLRKELPVVMEGTYMLPDGTITNEITTAQQTSIALYKQWQYYKLFDQLS